MTHRKRCSALLLAGTVALALTTGCGAIAKTSSATTNQVAGGNNGSGSQGGTDSGSGSTGSGNSGSGSGSSGSGTGSSGNGGNSGTGSTGTASGALALLPANAVAVNSIQALDNWKATYDTATSGATGTATGVMNLVTEPSQSGQAREFQTTYSNAGGERYSVSFGADPLATNFLYDAWVYLPEAPTGIANLEFDMNQVMANGQTVIFGFQCDGYSSTWDYSENTGTPDAPAVHWVKTSQPCNVHNWSVETWHHVQVSYSRDNSGNVTYKSVWLDSVEQKINATAPSAFTLGWKSTLLTNFQVDGVGATGSSTVCLDNLTVYRW